VVATINDTGTAANAEVAAAMGDAGIPRVAMNVSPADWAEPLSYPLDSSATGGVFVLPQALVDAGSTEIGIVRVSAAAAAALVGLLQGLYEDDGVTFPVDLPVDPGTTDYSQFPLRVEDAGATSMSLALGEAESAQVIRATQQLGSDLLIGTLAFTHDSTAELDDFAEQMVMVAPYPPATVDLPVYRALRGDLAASGDEQLQPEAMTINTMRSWIGLYALLRVIRDAGLEDLTRGGIDAALRAARDVPMLGIFGDAGWTPALDHPGAFKRAGIDRVAVYRWDPRSTAAGFKGNFVEAGTISFDDVLCGSPLGAPAPC
jgi:hypothetical protein